MRIKYLLSIAVCVHLTAAAGVHLAGRRAMLPGMFDEGGIASFATDGRVYRLQMSELEKTLRESGAGAWLRTPAPVHVKLYSLSYALCRPLFGQTILSAEPLNLLYYLATLLLIYAVGGEAFGEREGLLAAGMFAALVPSYLLHTTQLLKDPLFVVLALALVLVCVKWLTTEYAWAGGLAAGSLGGGAAASIWLVKDSVWWVVLAIMFLGAALSVAQQAGRRAVLGGNLAGIAVMLAIALGASYFVTPYKLPMEYWAPHRPGARAARPTEKAEGGGARVAPPAGAPAAGPDGRPQPAGQLSRVVGVVARSRSLFVELYPDAGSNVDSHVRFEGLSDVVRYLPRAAVVGLCAPFPNMWLRAGEQVGSAGRLLSGCETLLMYVIILFAAGSLWRARRRPAVWLLALTALIGVTALGMVVVNVGALYRQRYLFWILFVIVGAETVSRMMPARRGGDASMRAGHGPLASRV